MPKRIWLRPTSPCEVCGRDIEHAPRVGPRRRYCPGECAREADRVLRAMRREGISISEADAELQAEGAARLSEWVVPVAEARAAVRSQLGPEASLSAGGFVWDEWRTHSRDDLRDVSPGDEVGQTCPRAGRTIGATDRPWDWAGRP